MTLTLLCAFLLYSSSIKGSAFTHFCVFLGGWRVICVVIDGLNPIGLHTLKFLLFNPNPNPNPNPQSQS